MVNISGSLTANQVVVLRTLSTGPKKWSELRRAYFGEERAKQSASTSFYMQIKNCTGKGFLTKTQLGYEITPKGAEVLQAARDAGLDVDSVKTQAQLQFEASGIVAAKIAQAKVETPTDIEA